MDTNKTGIYRTAKLNGAQVMTIRHWLAEGIRGFVLAQQFGVSKQTISAIKHRHIWKNGYEE